MKFMMDLSEPNLEVKLGKGIPKKYLKQREEKQQQQEQEEREQQESQL